MINNLLSTHPDLCKEWDYEKNIVNPNEITHGSNKKIYWKCNKGHSWLTTPNNRICNKTGCPYCSNNKVLKGFNDLLSNFPDLCKEWDYEKNTIKPDEITNKSSKKVYWKCNKGHSWKTIVYNRTKNKTGCPKCNNNKTSFGEQCIYYYLLPYKAQNRFKLDNMEIDVYLSEMNIGIGSDKTMPVGIEFNGLYWHEIRKEHDLIKELKLSHKVKMYYVCESDKNEIKGNKIFFNKEKYNLNLEWALKTLFTLLNLNIDVNIDRDKQIIYKNSVKEEKENSLAFKFTNLLKEWDYTKNSISPDQVVPGSHKKVYWKCDKGHSWEMQIIKRTQVSHGCPYCSNHRVLKGFNDLLTTHPDLCKEWDYEKNIIKPDEITFGTGKKIYWKCNNGHSWECSITSRTGKRKYGCPYCSNHRILKGFNDLQTTHPDLLKEWDYEKNILNPDEITFGSGKKVYWKCNNNHSWLAIIALRTGQNSGCPICSKEMKTKYEN